MLLKKMMNVARWNGFVSGSDHPCVVTILKSSEKKAKNLEFKKFLF